MPEQFSSQRLLDPDRGSRDSKRSQAGKEFGLTGQKSRSKKSVA